MVDFDEVIRQARACGERTVDGLFEAYYEELRSAVRRSIRSKRQGLDLDATHLLSAAYLRLRELRGIDWKGVNHFEHTVARAARRALVDEIRVATALKRGGGLQRTTLSHLESPITLSIDHLISLDVALERLAQGRSGLRQICEIVDLHYFLGYSPAEIAELLGVSDRTVRRGLVFARVWLRREVGI